MEKLSKKQADVLLEIEVIKMRREVPTCAHLARHFGVSYQSMRTKLLELQKKGYIEVMSPVKGMTVTTSSKYIAVIKPLIMDKVDSYVSVD